MPRPSDEELVYWGKLSKPTKLSTSGDIYNSLSLVPQKIVESIVTELQASRTELKLARKVIFHSSPPCHKCADHWCIARRDYDEFMEKKG